MGVDDFFKWTRDALGIKRGCDDISSLAGATLAVDISFAIHGGLATAAGSAQFHAQPSVPVTSLKGYIKRLINQLKSCNIVPFIVFDRIPHPGKKRVTEERLAEINKNSKLLSDCLALGYAADLIEVNRFRKRSVYIRDDVIKVVTDMLDEEGVRYIGSATEAEAQCVALEKHGLVDGILSNDADAFILGANVLVTDLTPATPTSKGACNIYYRSLVMKRVFGDCSDSDMVAAGCLLGNDYILRVRGNSPEKVIEKILPKWKKANEEEKQNILKGFVNKQYNGGGGSCSKFLSEFNTAYSLCKYLPVLIPTTPIGNDRSSPTFWEFAPLNKLEHGKAWNEIGYDPLALFQSFGFGPDDCAFMKKSWRTKETYVLPPKPKDPKNPNRTVAYGSVLDFEKCSIQLTPRFMLIIWLSQRSIPLPQSVDTSDLVEYVEHISQLPVQPDIIDDKDDDANSFSHYVDWETLFTDRMVTFSGGDEAVKFIRNEVGNVDKHYIDSVFGHGRNGVRHRAFLRVISGHYDLLTLRKSNAMMKSTNEHVVLIEIKCTPSMNAEVYSVVLVFDQVNNFNINASRCSCPSGNFFL